jgi:hypothetical protein
MPYWSFSAWAKLQVKHAVNFIGEFQRVVADEARKNGADGVICGHIHHAVMEDMDGIRYINTGDWVESCTAIAEHEDGTFELIEWRTIGGAVSLALGARTSSEAGAGAAGRLMMGTAGAVECCGAVADIATGRFIFENGLGRPISRHGRPRVDMLGNVSFLQVTHDSRHKAPAAEGAPARFPAAERTFLLRTAAGQRRRACRSFPSGSRCTNSTTMRSASSSPCRWWCACWWRPSSPCMRTG